MHPRQSVRQMIMNGIGAGFLGAFGTVSAFLIKNALYKYESADNNLRLNPGLPVTASFAVGLGFGFLYERAGFSYEDGFCEGTAAALCGGAFALYHWSNTHSYNAGEVIVYTVMPLVGAIFIASLDLFSNYIRDTDLDAPDNEFSENHALEHKTIVYHKTFSQRLNDIHFDESKIPSYFIDHVTQEIMNDPVSFRETGTSADRSSANSILKTTGKCPTEGIRVTGYSTNKNLKCAIEEFVSTAESNYLKHLPANVHAEDVNRFYVKREQNASKYLKAHGLLACKTQNRHGVSSLPLYEHKCNLR